jgi:hypothetical protein
LINPDNGDAYYQTGLAYFTLKSTTAGNKTIVAKASEQSYQYWAGFDTTSITFTAPATNTTTAAKPAVTAQTPSADPAAPAVPALTVLKVGGEEIKPEEAPQKQLQVGQPVVFSGKTIPNGKVTLTFHSDPFTDTVTADANGDWNYTLTKDLGTGDHT